MFQAFSIRKDCYTASPDDMVGRAQDKRRNRILSMAAACQDIPRIMEKQTFR